MGRTEALTAREATAYLVEVTDEGRALVLDHAVRDGDGWRLASGEAVRDAGGAVIAAPSLADILASDPGEGRAWREERLSFDAFGALGDVPLLINYIDGVAVDYSVRVEDELGAFSVWARNLERALDHQELQTRRGVAAPELGLRNYALDTEGHPGIGNDEDSHARVEVLTPQQVRFAAAVFGIDFDPTMFAADGGADGAPLAYGHDIPAMLGLMRGLIDTYAAMRDGIAVRVAAQTGLSAFFEGVAFDPETDGFVPVGGRELTPLYEAILRAAPEGREATGAYLEDWHGVLRIVYADYRGPGGVSQDAIFRGILGAFETVGGDAELRRVAEALGVDEDRLIEHTAAATDVRGTAGDDLFYVSVGDQTFRGGVGHDTYVIGADFGQDVIADVERPLVEATSDGDTLWFAHVRSDQVFAYKDGHDLVIEVVGTDDRLTVRDQFDGVQPAFFFADISPNTEMVTIHFADGVVWDEVDIAWATSHPDDADQIVQGTAALDVLDGGRGNDVLLGGRGSDLYVFDLGYGNDRIREGVDWFFDEGIDIVSFGEGITADTLRLTRVGSSDDLVIALLDEDGAATDDSLTVQGQFGFVQTGILGLRYLDRIERFTFADNTFLTEEDVMRQVLANAGTGAGDAIYGFHFDDRLDGGAGDDYLTGRERDDTYVFARGYGHDVVDDNMLANYDLFTGSYDTLAFTDIASTDVSLIREGPSQTVTIALAGADDRITIRDQFTLTVIPIFGSYHDDRIERFAFSDGAVWDSDALARRLLEQARTDGDDVIYGFDRADRLDGGAGDDRLEGGALNDTYVWDRGMGSDVIFDTGRGGGLSRVRAGYDTALFGALRFDDVIVDREGTDLFFTDRVTGERLTLEGQYDRERDHIIERLVFADRVVDHGLLMPDSVDLVGTSGDDTLTGTHYAETIDGREGNDRLVGSSDADAYRFDAAYGQDVIYDRQDGRWAGDDVVLFGPAITRENVRFSVLGSDLLVTIEGHSDTLRIERQFGSVREGVEGFRFADGAFMSITDVEELLTITGSGRGDDVVEGFVGRENVLDGRGGDDTLIGADRSDTYAFGVGYGNDVIEEYRDAASADGHIDQIVFGELVTTETLTIRRVDDDLIFGIEGTLDTLRVLGGLGGSRVERYAFADGTVWTFADVARRMLEGTDGSDRLIGFDDVDDTLDGGLGSDDMRGGGGDDTYVYEIGDGNDTIFDTGGTDRIVFGDVIVSELVGFARDGDTLVIRFGQFGGSLAIIDALSNGTGAIESFVFADGVTLTSSQLLQVLTSGQQTAGDDVVRAFEGGQTITGGAGDDFLAGGSGADTYVYRAGDGRDVILDVEEGPAGVQAADRLVVERYTSDQVTVRQPVPGLSDVLLDFAGEGDEILIRNGLDGNGRLRLEAIAFADGVVWTFDDLIEALEADRSTDGADLIFGSRRDDTLEGGRGDDTLIGEGGADTYVFTSGDGQDVVVARGGTLEIRGYAADEVSFSVIGRADAGVTGLQDVRVVLGGGRDTIVLAEQFQTGDGAFESGVDRIAFGDGTEVTRADLVARLSTAGGAADDSVSGTNGADTLTGGAGEDVLSGRDGSDLYVFEAGDGRDTIEDRGRGDTDVVEVRGHAYASARFARDGEHLVITFEGSDDRLTINWTLNGSSDNQIEVLRFADDGTELTMDDLRPLLLAAAATDGDDRIEGFSRYDDTLTGGAGDDVLSGRDGSDLYVFEAGDGHDTIQDNGRYDTDVVEIRGHAYASARFVREGDHLIVTFAGSDDRLTINWTLNGSSDNQIEVLRFADDGTELSMDDLRPLLLNQAATDGDDRIEGFSRYDDTITGGAGDDFLSGRDGSDLYVFEAGDGRDTIQDNGRYDTDVVEVRGHAYASARFARDGNHLIVTFAGSDDRLTINWTLNGSSDNQIEVLRFADDGTELTMDDVRDLLTASTDGADEIVGFGTQDTLAGGLGDDTVSGGDQIDTYVFSRGDGRDLIEDRGNHHQYGDVLEIHDYDYAEVRLSRSGSDLIVRFDGTDDAITVRSALSGDLRYQIETFRFVQDGTILTIDAVKALLVAQAATAGDDVIVGFGTQDMLAGGRGDDTMSGGDQIDTYVFARGDGRDLIEDRGNHHQHGDALEIQGYDYAEARFFRNGDDLLIRFDGTDDVITVASTLSGDRRYQIETFRFVQDGTILTLDDVRALDPPADVTQPVFVEGTGGADTIEAAPGPELLSGRDGSDLYVFEAGDGRDTIEDRGRGDTDVVEVRGHAYASARFARDGEHLVIAFEGSDDRLTIRWTLEGNHDHQIETIRFAEDGTELGPDAIRALLIAARTTDGDDDIVGFNARADTLTGGAGDDFLSGWDGSDLYVFEAGDGHDVIEDRGRDDTDVVEVRGHASTDARFARDGQHLIVTFAGSDDRLQVNWTLDGNREHQIETIRFADGVAFTVDDMRAAVIAGEVTAGDDRLDGFHVSSDTLTGGRGDDTLSGSGSSDLYVFHAGDGRDVIDDNGNGDDTLEIRGHAVEDARFARDGEHLVITFEGSDDRILILRTLEGSRDDQIETIRFGDGTAFTMHDMRARLVDVGTDGDDVIRGFYWGAADTLVGGRGDDTLSGSGSSDLYVFHAGDGRDVIEDNGNGDDTLEIRGYGLEDVRFAREGDDLLITFEGSGDRISIPNTLEHPGDDTIETIRFVQGGQELSVSDIRAAVIAGEATAGDDRLDGFYWASDTLSGGRGDDTLSGSGSSDLYVFNAGDGRDVIEDNGNGDDTLEIRGHAYDTVRFGRSEADLVITFEGSDDRVTVRGTLDGGGDDRIETIRFADDGVALTIAEVTALIVTGLASDAADIVEGSVGADTLIGAEGDDYLSGGAGDDTYVFRAGDGRDVIHELGDGQDVLRIEGYAAADVSFGRLHPYSSDLVVRFGDDGDEVVIIGGLSAEGGNRVERFVFAEGGAELTLPDVLTRVLLSEATDGRDVIRGTSGDDTLTGGAGDDVLSGERGSDTYLYARGDGADIVYDSGLAGEGTDTVRIEGYAPDDLVSIGRRPPDGDDLILTFAEGDALTLIGALSTTGYGIDEIAFEDGTVWTVSDLRARLLTAAADDGANQIHGFELADVLTGGRGDDVLRGGDGDDTYRYAKGDGADTIIETGGADRVVIEGYASIEASVARFYRGDDGIVIRFAGNPDDSVTILDTLHDGQTGVEEIAFSDGVVWTMETVLGLLDNEAPVTDRDGPFAATQGVPATIAADTLTRNDFDPDGQALTLIAVSNAVGGTVQLDGGGNVVFTAFDDHVGEGSFDYTVSDGANGLATQTVQVSVRPPVSANDDSGLTTFENGTLIVSPIRLLANDTDGDVLTIAEVRGARGGTVAMASNGDIVFTPTPNTFGEASFEYVATGPGGGSTTATVSIWVEARNTAPIAGEDALSLAEGDTFLIEAASLLANDTDIDGDALRITEVIGNADIAVTLTVDGRIQVAPVGDFFGQTAFAYTVVDGQGGSASGTVRVVVDPVNDLPVLGADAFETDEDTPLLIAPGALLGNDRDADGDPLTVVAVTGADLLPNGAILFTPPGNFFGDYTLTYTVDDGQGGVVTQDVTITVAPVNDAPSVRPESFEVLDVLRGVEDTALVIDPADLLRNDTDPDGDALAITAVSGASHGEVVLREDGMIVFQPDADYWGVATFSYLVSDGDMTTAGGASVYFEPVSDAPPVAGDDQAETDEDTPIVLDAAFVLANDTDIDGDALSIAAIGLTFGGSATIDPDGNIVFAPGLDFSGSAFVDYVVTDGADGTDTGTITISVLPVNDAPVVRSDLAVGTLGAPVVIRISDLLANDTDVDGDVLSFLAPVIGPDGSASVYGDEFVVLELGPSFSGSTFLDYDVSDPSDATSRGRVQVTVDPQRAEVIDGTDLRDLLIGGAQAEAIHGGAGRDDLLGRAGDDTLVGGDGGDLIDGGDGVDTADYVASNTGVRVDLAARIGQGGHAQGDVFVSVENVVGTAFADTLEGSLADNRLVGGEGDDDLYGRGGADTLDGGAGDDTLTGGQGADVLLGGAGSDTADYAASGDGVRVALDGSAGSGGDAEGDVLDGIENLTGSNAADDLTGDEGANRLDGGRGADTLIGGAGDDTLIGGRGGDRMEGGAGTDTVSYRGSAAGVVVDLSGETAGGGDAEGDAFSSIEVVEGSFYDDRIVGDAADNVLRGGLGADTLAGGAGHDAASYEGAASAVRVDLGAGTGDLGDAAGDVLSSIEEVRGSDWDDHVAGGAGAETLSGGRGADTLEGRSGGDTYAFGYGSGDDVVREAGAAGDVDRVAMAPGVLASDVTLVRDGDDLLLILEGDGGVLRDTMRIESHFASEAAGIEAVAFADGTVWDRADILARYRNDRFDAQDDLIRWADEDAELVIASGRLTRNDTESSDDRPEIIWVGDGVGGSVSLDADGDVVFLSDADFNGTATFAYQVSDGRGRVSTARVAVEVLPVNDAPVAGHDAGFSGLEDQGIVISLAELTANDLDVDGDALFIVGVAGLQEEGAALADVMAAAGNYRGTNGAAGFGAGGVTFTGDRDYFGAAGFAYVVSDGAGGFSWANVELTVIGVNDAPNARSDGFSIRADETLSVGADGARAIARAPDGHARVVIDPLALLANDYDVESDAFGFASVQDAENGAVAIQDGMIVFVPMEGFVGEAGFAYTIVDGDGQESVARVSIGLREPNDPPQAGDDRFEVPEDGELVLDPSDLLANDFDANADALTIIALDDYAERGTVRFEDRPDPDGDARQVIVFTPDPEYNGPASFTYTISDGRGGVASATVLIDVTPTNDAPVANDDRIVGQEDVPLRVSAFELLANDTDPEGDFLVFDRVEIVDASDSDAQLSAVDDAYVLQTAGDWSGALTLRYRTVDTLGAVSNWASVLVVIEPQDDAPTGGDDRFATDEDTALTIATADLLSNDSHPDGRALDIVLFNQPEHGSLSIQDGFVVYRPDTNFFGADTFTYVLGDDIEAEALVTVTIDIAPVNDAPVARDDGIETVEDQAAVFTVADLLSNDTDPDEGDAPRFVSHTQVGHGTLTLEDGVFTYVPDAEFFGRDAFTYTVEDADGVQSQATVVLTVTPDNDAPVIEGDVFHTSEDTPVTVGFADLLANDRDPDGDVLTVTSVSAVAIRPDGTAFGDGRATILPGDRVSFAPGADFVGTVLFEYVVSDGAATATGTVQVVVSAVNDAPSVRGEDGYVVDEDQVLRIAIADLLANDTDVEGDALRLTDVFDAVGGTVRLDGGFVVFEGGADYFGSASFGYTVEDVHGAAASASVALTIAPVADAPVAVTDTGFALDEDGIILIDPAALVANDTDPDGDALGFAGLGASAFGDLSMTADGLIRFAPAADFFGQASFTYLVTDGALVSEGTAELLVIAREDAPIARADVFSTPEDTERVLTAEQLLANDFDPDGDDLRIEAVSNAVGGTVSVLADGTISFVPATDHVGGAGFDYVVADASGNRSSATVTITVSAVNDAPLVTRQLPVLEVEEDGVIDFAVPEDLFADADGDALALTVRLADGAPLPSWLSFDGRDLTGTPPANFNGALSLAITASDGQASASATLTISVAAVNDLPSVGLDRLVAVEDEALRIEASVLLANDADADGDAFEIVAVADGTGGAVRLDADGAVVFTPTPDFFGAASFTYTVRDAFGGEATGQVFVDVVPVDDAPVLAVPLADQSGAEDEGVEFLLPEGAFTDAEGAALSLTARLADGRPLPEWLVFDGAGFRGMPPADYHGVLAIEVRASDGANAAVGDFVLTIEARNDAPSLVLPLPDRYVREDTSFALSLLEGAFEDVDGDALTLTASLAGGGALPTWLAFDAATGTFTGTLPANFDERLSITVTASDGALSVSDTFDLVVDALNDAPTLVRPLDDVTIDEDAELEIVVPEDAFADVDGDALTLTASVADGSPLPEGIVVDGFTIRGRLPTDFFGAVDILVTASDGSAEASDVFTLTVNPVDDVPTALDDRFVANAGSRIEFSAGTLEGNDIDPDGDTLSIVAVDDPIHGAIRYGEDGTIVYEADDEYVGEDQFVYTVTDGRTTSTALVTIDLEDPFAGYGQGTDAADALFGALFGANRIFGGGGDDLIVGGFYRDDLQGASGNDALFGGWGGDTLGGGSGNDALFGGIGADVLSGGRGDDALFGGWGADQFNFARGDGRDTVQDFGGRGGRRRFFFEGDTVNIGVGGVSSFADLMDRAEQVGRDAVFDFGDGDVLILRQTRLAALDPDAFTFF